jgi:transcriptional regulator with XRE-family HTH domain
MSLEVIKNSGLRQKTELECLLGVTRMSLHKYFNGKSSPREEIATRIAKLTVLIEKLTASGILPLTDKTDEPSRKAIVAKLQSTIHQ